jgi:hypothetical protein
MAKSSRTNPEESQEEPGQCDETVVAAKGDLAECLAQPGIEGQSAKMLVKDLQPSVGKGAHFQHLSRPSAKTRLPDQG